MKYENKEKNIKIYAEDIEIGENVKFGDNINIKINGKFKIGNHSRLGSNTKITGNNIILGEHLFNSSGLIIGGGGRYHPNANLTIGDRCTIHNNFINVCEDIIIGNDVGLSPDVSILSHGYWLSVLEGYPAKFSGVKIGNSVIVGYRSLIMMGVSIANEVVVGASSVVTKSIDKKGIYAGNPARFLKEIKPLTENESIEKVQQIVIEYKKIAKYHNITPKIKIDYPLIYVNDLCINVITQSHEGTEDNETDDFRDYVRKWGIRIYTSRGFKSILPERLR